MSATVTDPIRGSSEPDRFWTTTNLGEACPDVMTPMCWSVWEEPAELGWLYSMYALGAVPRSRLRVSPNVNDRGLSCFYGRQALNVDAIKQIMAGIPGIDPDDFERDLMGSVRDGAPKVKGSLKQVPAILVRAPWALLTTGRRLRAMYDEMYGKWLDTVFTPPQSGGLTPIDALVTAREDFKRAFALHCVWRFIFQGGQSAVTSAAENIGSPSLAVDLLSGVGEVNETKMADDLWRLGKGQISEDEFLSSWGYHGPNEGNVYTTVWRENPGPIRSMAAAAAQRDIRPADRAVMAQSRGAEAERILLSGTPLTRRFAMRWLIGRMRKIIRMLQVGKASYLIAIDKTRHAAREFGRQQVEAGAFNEVDDVFFLTVEECQQLAAGNLPDVARIVVVRRETRSQYKTFVLPLAFIGMPVPLESSDASDDLGTVEFKGAASGGGVVEGRARVVLDPAEDIDLEPGDILVCRFTDPSWAPLMAMAEALVIDIGGSASHGAVVARELDLPYVIGAESATRTVRDGDRILVDGTNNVVRVIDRADGLSGSAAAV